MLAAAAGAALPLAFAPYGLWPLAVLSLAVLFGLWQGASPGRAAWLGYAYGLGMFGHGVWWIQVSIHKFGLPLYAFSVSMTALFVLFLALYPALAGYLSRRLPAATERLRLLLLMPALWVLLEWVRSVFLSGFPWLLLGYSHIDGWLAGYAPLGGVHAVGLASAWLSALTVAALRGSSRRRAGSLLAMILIAVAGAGLGMIEWTRPQGAPLSVALVQGAVPQEVKWRPEYRAATIELYQALSAAHWGKSILIWPESAVPGFPQDFEPLLEDLDATARESGTALLVGMPTGDPERGPYYNSLLLLGADGGRYDKFHLVPFGEYLPLERVLRPVLDFLTIPMSSFSPGRERQPPLEAGGLRIGASICYEDAYASEVRKPLPEANLLVNVSDDAWFGDTRAPHQHLEIARMRALEAGRYLLRATNTGISAIIDARGRISARSPQFEPYVLTGAAWMHEGATPFVRTGHAPVLLLALSLVAAACLAGRRLGHARAGG